MGHGPWNQTVFLTLSGFYFFFFGALGIFLPYWPLYLASLGCDPRMIGWLTSAAQGIKILGPPIWGGWADRGSRHRVIIVTSFANLFSFGLYFLDAHFVALLLATLIFSLFQGGPLALVEATTIETVSRHGGDYGRIRVWGSIGFILFALGLGSLVDRLGIGIVPMAIALLLLGQALLSLFLPDTQIGQDHARKSAPWEIFRQVGMRWFYGAAFFQQLSHGAYYGFFSVHLTTQGFSPTAIGFLWALGVLAEIGILSHSNFWLRRFGISRLLSFSILLAGIRWVIYASTVSWFWLLLAQCLHAFTFGAFHVASVRRIHLAAPETSRSSAQAWYGAISFGLGGSVGLLFSGYLFHAGGAPFLFGGMAGATLLGLFASWRSTTCFLAPTDQEGLAP